LFDSSIKYTKEVSFIRNRFYIHVGVKRIPFYGCIAYYLPTYPALLRFIYYEETRKIMGSSISVWLRIIGFVLSTAIYLFSGLITVVYINLFP